MLHALIFGLKMGGKIWGHKFKLVFSFVSHFEILILFYNKFEMSDNNMLTIWLEKESEEKYLPN